MSITARSAHDIVRLLNQKVRDGLLDKTTAQKLALVAMQEVAVSEDEVPQDTTQPGEAPAAENAEDLVQPESEEPADAPPPPTQSADPKTQILALLTQFETETASSFGKFKASLDGILMGTADAAFPMGDFEVSSEGNQCKVSIGKGDKQNEVNIKFTFARDWNKDGVKPPAPAVQASAEPVCHLGLRKELMAATDDIVEFAETDKTWQRSSLAVGEVSKLVTAAAKENDTRLVEVLTARPKQDVRKDWRRWSIAAQAYLIGLDFSKDKKFADVLKNLKLEDSEV